MTPHDAVQIMTLVLREQTARQFQRAQYRGLKAEPAALEFILQKAVIKTRVVGHEHIARQTPGHFMADRGKGGIIPHQLIINAGQPLDRFRDRLLWIDQGLPFRHQLAAPHVQDRKLGDPITLDMRARGFDINKDRVLPQHATGRRFSPGSS